MDEETKKYIDKKFEEHQSWQTNSVKELFQQGMAHAAQGRMLSYKIVAILLPIMLVFTAFILWLFLF